MPRDQIKEERRDRIRTGAAIAGLTAASTVAAQRALERRAQQRQLTEHQRMPTPRPQSSNLTASAPDTHPLKRLSDNRWSEDPATFRRQVKAGRLARRARAATRRMGALGAVVGAADMVGAAKRIEKEGGAFEARFGKFVEEMLGVAPGTTGRPLTDAEVRARLEI